MKLKAFHSYQELCNLTINHNPPYPPIPSGEDDICLPIIGFCNTYAGGYPVGNCIRRTDDNKLFRLTELGNYYYDNEITSINYSAFFPCGGTCAHEFIELVGQGDLTKNLAYSNLFAMESWVKEYGVLNGIWLTELVVGVLLQENNKKPPMWAVNL